MANNAFRMTVKVQDILTYPYNPTKNSEPATPSPLFRFSGHWANRLDDTVFYGTGKTFALNLDLGVVPDGRLPDQRYAMAGYRSRIGRGPLG